MKHFTFLVYVIASTVPELATEIEIFSNGSPSLFYALFGFFFLKNNSPMH